MITNTKQNWQIGKTVKVGFLTLIITNIRQVKDGLPDIYDLVSPNREKQYEFIPHNGLRRVI